MPIPAMASVRARIWGLAALCAAWVVGWPLSALESTRGLRGMLDFSGDRGAYDLLALVHAGPESVLYAALFLVCLVSFRAMLGVVLWLDRDRRALDALRWAFGVRSVRASFVAVFAFLLAMLLVPEHWRDPLRTVALCVLLAAFVVSRFAIGCPTTLLRDRDVGGWRLYWPGVGALIAITVLWAVSDPGLKLLAAAIAEDSGFWAQAAIQAIVVPVDMVFVLVQAAIWFGYRRGASLAQAWAALRQWRFLRAYLGSGVYVALGGCLAAVPIIVTLLMAMYVAPQYGDPISTQSGSQFWLLQCLNRLGLAFRDDGWAFVLLPLIVWMGFADNRLIFRDGLGDRLGPEAPSP